MYTEKTAWSRDELSTCAHHPFAFHNTQKAAQAVFAMNSIIWQLGVSSPKPKLDVKLPTLKPSYLHCYVYSLSIALLKDNIFCPLGRITYSFIRWCRLILLQSEDPVLHLRWSFIKGFRTFPLLNYRVFLCWSKYLKLNSKDRACSN